MSDTTQAAREHMEAECLRVNPFDGDFGSPDDRVLSDKMVTSRGGKPCFLCRCIVQPGERTRVHVAIYDGDMQTYRWCALCCHAMAMSVIDEGMAWERRKAIGRQNHD